MKAKRIDHVGIVVKDLDVALATYQPSFWIRPGPGAGR